MQSRRSAEAKAARKTEKQKQKKKEQIGSAGHSVEDLVAQAQIALQSFKPELALKFFERAHTAAPDDTMIMDALADVHLQLGEPEEALELLQTSTTLAPAVNPFKWLFLAQLQQGTDAVASYKKAIELLSELFLRALRARGPLDQREGEGEVAMETTTPEGEGEGGGGGEVGGDTPPPAIIKRQIARAHVAIAELYLTDLCFDDGAEQLCAASVGLALELEPEGLDALQCLASLKLSQGDEAGAGVVMSKVHARVQASRDAAASRTIIQELAEAAQAGAGAGAGAGEEAGAEEEEADAPEVEFCVQTAKLLTECAMADRALASAAAALCASLLEEDDENIEVWYIAGVAALSSSPVDKEAGLYHLKRAKEMVLALIEQGQGQGGEAGLQEQLDLIDQHLAMLGPEGGGGGEGGEDMEEDEEWTDEDEDEDEEAEEEGGR